MFHIEPAHALQSVQAPLPSLNRSLDNLPFTIYVYTAKVTNSYQVTALYLVNLS